MTTRFAIVSLLLSVFFIPPPSINAYSTCPPTRPDAEGPFYKPSVPLTESTGSGLVIQGMVRTAGTCKAIAGARVEWWQTAPSGQYDDAHRGAMITDNEGKYRFETDPPPPYSGRPSHVHFKILAIGHKTLTTQVYPKPDQPNITFDFILVPLKS